MAENEKRIKSLNRYADRCRKISSANVYESDKEVAESIGRAPKDIKGNVIGKRRCRFTVVKKS